jgi:hypothetical protein
VLSAIEPKGKPPEPGSWDDPKVQRALRIGRILGPAIIVVPLGLAAFIRLAPRVTLHAAPGEDGKALLGVGILVAIGMVVAIAAYARRGFNQR